MTSSPVPKAIEALNGKKVTSLSCGLEHSALIADNQLYTWGLGESGRLGHGDQKNLFAPTLVAFFQNKNPQHVICGSDWTTILTENGDLYTFGYGANGRLGIGSDTPQSSPQKVENLPRKTIVQVACGHDHTMVLFDNGDVYGYGYGGNGRLGNGSELDEKLPR